MHARASYGHERYKIKNTTETLKAKTINLKRKFYWMSKLDTAEEKIVTLKT